MRHKRPIAHHHQDIFSVGNDKVMQWLRSTVSAEDFVKANPTEALDYYGEIPFPEPMDKAVLRLLEEEPSDKIAEGMWYLNQHFTFGRTHQWKKKYYFKVERSDSGFYIADKWAYGFIYHTKDAKE